jgi:hypothetical protein
MSLDELCGPDLDGVVADANAVGLPYVVIGGFSVIAHGYVRATRDSDLLIADGAEANEALLRFFDRTEATRVQDGEPLSAQEMEESDHLRVRSKRGIIDILRGGIPPLDYETVAARAIEIDRNGEPARFASLRSLVGFKRLAGRPQDRVDLEHLQRVNGELPIDPIPGLDND